MKNILYLSLIVVLLASCDMKDEYEQINSNAVEYAGDWYYKVSSGDQSTELKAYDSGRMTTFNTAADVENEIWIDDKNGFLSMKFKCVFEGDMASFVAPSSENIRYSDAVRMPDAPKGLGMSDTYKQDYSEFEVVKGMILLNAASSKTGKSVDSLYLHLKGMREMFTFNSIVDGIDTTWGVLNTDSILAWEVDTTVHVLAEGSTHWNEEWTQINDTVFYQIDSTENWSWTEVPTVDQIDTTYMWDKTAASSVIEEVIVSGHRFSGYLEDYY